MGAYEYQAIDVDGKPQKGLIEADTAKQARQQLRGMSLVPAMHGSPVERPIFSETNYRDYTFKRSLTTPDGWKLIYTLEDGRRELYDLNNDPGELSNLANAHTEHADKLQRQLFGHFKAIGHDLTARDWKVGINPVYPSQTP